MLSQVGKYFVFNFYGKTDLNPYLHDDFLNYTEIAILIDGQIFCVSTLKKECIQLDDLETRWTMSIQQIKKTV